MVEFIIPKDYPLPPHFIFASKFLSINFYFYLQFTSLKIRDEDPTFFSTDPDPAQLKKIKQDPDPT